jgi:iron complex transport system ATP-binding protein
MTDLLIDIRNATVARPQVILDAIDFQIAPLQHTAIVGPNGSGKSTFIRLLMRDLYPAYVRGDEAVNLYKGRANWSMAELRQSIALVSMKFADALLDVGGLNVYDSVASSYFGTYGFYKTQDLTADMVGHIEEVMARLDLLPLARRQIQTLSTGQMRKVLIARAMVLRPDLILLDEPTLGLDIRAQSEFLDYLDHIGHSTTIIMVTHHLEEVVPLIQKVLLIKDGRVFAFGDTADVLTSDNLTALFGIDLVVRRSAGEVYSMHRT